MHGEGRRRIALVLAALLFFAGPALAGLLGDRAGTIENRRLASFPSPTQGWSFLPGLSQWATDHMPLRDRAVRANTVASEWAFREMPATAGSPPPVIVGRDDWLFLTFDLTQACTYQTSQSDINTGLLRFSALTRRLGVRLVTTVAPDKTTVETDRLPERRPQRECAVAAKAELWQRLQANPPPGYVDLYAPLLRAKQQYGAVYMPQDTHFNDRGNVAFATSLAAAFDPRLVADLEVKEAGPRTDIGDLSVIMGMPGTTTFPGVTMQRPGVIVTQTSTTPYITSTATSTGAPLVPGRTLLIGDSFSAHVLSWLQPFFADLTYLPLSVDPATFAGQLRSADAVIFEQVERYFVQCSTPLLSADFLTAVADSLSLPAG